MTVVYICVKHTSLIREQMKVETARERRERSSIHNVELCMYTCTCKLYKDAHNYMGINSQPQPLRKLHAHTDRHKVTNYYKSIQN